MPVAGDYECFSDDWRRTNPDLVLFLPKQPPQFVEAVDHVLVDVTPGGDLLAVWTYGAKADASDQTVLYARSQDGGRTWSEPGAFDMPGPKYGQVACFGFPVISRTGRIYVFYNKAAAVGTDYTTSFMRCSYSDDDGRTWSPGHVDIPYRRTILSHPDPSVGTNALVWQKPIRDARDRVLVGYTEWSSAAAGDRWSFASRMARPRSSTASAAASSCASTILTRDRSRKTCGLPGCPTATI